MQTITDIDFIILNFLHEKLSCGFLDILMPMITFLGKCGHDLDCSRLDFVIF